MGGAILATAHRTVFTATGESQVASETIKLLVGRFGLPLFPALSSALAFSLALMAAVSIYKGGERTSHDCVFSRPCVAGTRQMRGERQNRAPEVRQSLARGGRGGGSRHG